MAKIQIGFDQLRFISNSS